MATNLATVGIEVATSGILKGIDSLKQLAKQGKDTETSLKGFEDAQKRVNKELEKSYPSTSKLNTSIGGLGKSFSSVSSSAGLFVSAIGGIGALGVAKQFISMADAMTNVESRLRLVTAGSADLAQVQSRLFDVAQGSRVSYLDLAQTYSQMARATKDLGISQASMLQITKTISQAVTISGGSASSAQAALIQLSQGFASGTLRGEELNSVMEQTPRLAQAIAEGMGVGIGRLREMGAAGELTAEKVMGALQRSAEPVNNEFAQMTVTVEQATTNASNSLLKLVQSMDKASGASTAVSNEMQAISRDVSVMGETIDNATKQGDNGFTALAKGAGVGAVRLAFGGINASANLLNGTINLLTGDILGLRTNLAYLPETFRSNAEQVAAMEARLKDADAQLANLQERSNRHGGGAFYDAEIARVKLLRGEYASALAEKKALTGDTSTSAGGGRGSINPQTVGQMAAAQSASEKSLQEIRMRSSGINKQYFSDMKTYQDALANGTITQSQYVKGMSELATATYKASAAGKDAAKAAKGSGGSASAGVSELANIQARIFAVQQNIDILKRYGSAADKITEGEQLAYKIQKEIDSGKLKASQVAIKQKELEAAKGLQSAQEQLKIEEKRVKGQSLTNELLQESTGLAADFHEQWQLIELSYDGSEDSLKRVQEAQAKLLAQQPFAKIAESIADANREAEQYLANMQKTQQREVTAIGMGGIPLQRMQRRNQVDDEFERRRQQLESNKTRDTAVNGGTLPANLAAFYETQAQGIESTYQRAVESSNSAFDQMLAKQADWSNGASAAWQNFQAEATNVAGMTQSIFENAFGSLENSLVGFVKTGKFDLQGFVAGIGEDVLRMLIKIGTQFLINAAIGKTAQGAATAASIAMGTATAAAWAPAAAMVSLASFGANSAPAMAGISSTAALTAGLSVLGFSEGGYTGPGGKYEAAGIVHKGEGVLSQRDMAALGGPAAFESFRSYLHSGYASGGTVGKSSEPAKMLDLSGMNKGTTVNVIEDANKAGQTETSYNVQGDEIINIFVANIRTGGKAAQAIENTYGMTRRGR